jgi:hypothetical protein
MAYQFLFTFPISIKIKNATTVGFFRIQHAQWPCTLLDEGAAIFYLDEEWFPPSLAAKNKVGSRKGRQN